MIFPAIFNDLGQFSEQLIYAQKDSLYGYFDQLGFQRIQPEFTEAFSFLNGRAKVKVGEERSESREPQSLCRLADARVRRRRD